MLVHPLLPVTKPLDPYHPASDLASEYTHRAYLRWDVDDVPPWKINHTSLLKNITTDLNDCLVEHNGIEPFWFLDCKTSDHPLQSHAPSLSNW